uniref:CNH domain-containing protein n=1 Tax=Syphacia muris TaxID=451379 RepID=A0A0N5AM33_9BILA
MFEAYIATEVASRLEKSVEVVSLAADVHAKNVYLGSKAGHLVSLTSVREGKRGYDLITSRSFEKKSVTNLQIVSDFGIILCLSDGQLSVHEILEPFNLKATISDIKPITSFSSHISQDDSFFYVAVSARKKIYFYKWMANDFINIRLEISPAYLTDNAQCVLWCDNIIALAVNNVYHYFTISNEETKIETLFNVGTKVREPLIVDFKEERMIGYRRDDYLIFQDYSGEPKPLLKVKFSECPLEIVYDAPYAVALLPKGKVEVRSVRPPMHIQTLQLNRASHLAKAMPGTVYVGSGGDVWLLDSCLHKKENVEKLVRDKHFELAIQIAERCEEIDEAGMIEIKRKAAFNLFCQRQFDEWLELHTEVKTGMHLFFYFAVVLHVMTVIAHFPRLLDFPYRKSLSSLLDDPLPDFAENDYKSGLLALARYLAAVRTEHAKVIANYNKLQKCGGNKISKEEIEHHKNVLQVVDTTLLKSYLQANESLVASLVRLPDNMCILADSEKILNEKQKYYELYLLYERRKLHDKALTLLKEHAYDTDSPLSGCTMTVLYLQRLGNANLDVILKYASWVLHENLTLGLSIFTYDDEEVRSLDRDRVLRYLAQECVAAIIPYLENIIFVWNEKRPKFHDALGTHYITQVKKLMTEYMSSLKDGESIVRAGEEEGALGVVRQKLAHFLRTSSSYSPEKLLVQLRHDSLYEERAVLLGRLKRHEQALAIYTSILKDYKAAEEYCVAHYNRNDPENSKVWLILLRMYTSPPDLSVLGVLQKDLYVTEPNQSEALRILKDHASFIDTAEALTLLPPDFSLKSVWNALEVILQATHDKNTSMRLHKAVCDAALSRCRDRLLKAQSVAFSLGYESECAFCSKKILNSAFARYPSGRLEHFYCYQSH